MDDLLREKQEIWLKMLFYSFALKEGEVKDRFYDFSEILFRHLKWIAKECKRRGIEYDFDKGPINIQKSRAFEIYEDLIEDLKGLVSGYENTPLFERIKEDEKYMIFSIQNLLRDESGDYNIGAFNRKKIYKDKKLSKTSTDALILFLFEETYKEYELIMVYTYMQNFTTSIDEFEVYQDLVDESYFHLKSFGNMLSKMGILAIPHNIEKSIYKVTDITKFLQDGIKEEEAAKEECIRLAKAVEDEELGKFFEFINFQESYHIELMKKLL